MKSAKIVTLTKEIVDSLLAMNTDNRKVRCGVIDRYKRDILAGNWILTGQGIGISDDGVLLDGQHRLIAVKECGYPPVEVVLVSGLSRESQKVVDQHAKRSARDVFRLSLKNEVSSKTPAILNVLARHEPKVSILKFSGSREHLVLTIEEMCEMFDLYGETIAAVCMKVRVANFFAAPLIAAFVSSIHHYGADESRVFEFLEQVELGENLNRKMPAYHLRNFIVTTRTSSSGGSFQQERYLKTRKAIDAFLAGEEMGVLRV